ncbi:MULTISPECIES: hypothetical protein [unclassified Ensifer]|uniref:hypothetical protein n=1 Tax=unclassified Ensifer TaxID=2633371 RepID=UPI001FCD7145|nr:MULTISPECIES: hypothetical protein [unclassified Ensifer]
MAEMDITTIAHRVVGMLILDKGNLNRYQLTLEIVLDAYKLTLRPPTTLPYQKRVGHWMHACFGNDIPYDAAERNFRFLEEALELAQSCGATAEDAGKLVDYVFNRPVGDPRQEVGGVEVTLAALCNAHGIDLDEAREAELNRVWSKADQIRAKHESKPKDIRSPLPGGAHG